MGELYYAAKKVVLEQPDASTATTAREDDLLQYNCTTVSGQAPPPRRLCAVGTVAMDTAVGDEREEQRQVLLFTI